MVRRTAGGAGPTDKLGWRPFTWPLSTDRVPAGRAYSGDDHDVYVWLTLNGLGASGDCPEGIATDAALERAVDIRLLDPRFEPVGPGERLRGHRPRRLDARLRPPPQQQVPALRRGRRRSLQCDVITAIIDGDARDPAKRRMAQEFLESNTVQVWINKQLEGR